MLFIFASTLAFSFLISTSPGIDGPCVTVPSMRPRRVGAVPVVIELLAPAVEPVEFAVPNRLVPGASGTLAEFPAPLGSLSELFSPPALAGPDGTPLMPAVPAPAEPAFGDPTALPVPAVAPLAAPPADAPPAAPPPLLLCANAAIGKITAAAIRSLTQEWFDMSRILILPAGRRRSPLSI
jgi:hypothetical protein